MISVLAYKRLKSARDSHLQDLDDEISALDIKEGL